MALSRRVCSVLAGLLLSSAAVTGVYGATAARAGAAVAGKNDKSDDKPNGNGKDKKDKPAAASPAPAAVPPAAPPGPKVTPNPGPAPARAPGPAQPTGRPSAQDKKDGHGTRPAPNSPAAKDPAPKRPAPKSPTRPPASPQAGLGTAGAPAPAPVDGSLGISAAPTAALNLPSADVVFGSSVGVAAATGSVRVRDESGGGTVSLEEATAIPVNSRIDARFGAVELTSAVDASGTLQTARFSGGVFLVRQRPDGSGVARVVLAGGDWRACKKHPRSRGRAVAAARRKPLRRLWGSDRNGRFETRGKNSVATVRGTRWLTEDFCDGTRTTVLEGSVAVLSIRTGKTTVVGAGESYFALKRTRR